MNILDQVKNQKTVAIEFKIDPNSEMKISDFKNRFKPASESFGETLGKILSDLEFYNSTADSDEVESTAQSVVHSLNCLKDALIADFENEWCKEGIFVKIEIHAVPSEEMIDKWVSDLMHVLTGR